MSFRASDFSQSDVKRRLRLLKLGLDDLAAVLRVDQRADLDLLAVGGLVERHGPALEHGGEGMGEGFHLGRQPGPLNGAEQRLERIAHGATLQVVVGRDGQVVAAVLGEAVEFDFVIGGEHRDRPICAPDISGIGEGRHSLPLSPFILSKRPSE